MPLAIQVVFYFKSFYLNINLRVIVDRYLTSNVVDRGFNPRSGQTKYRKKNLHSDGQHFPQYQQNEQLPFT